MKSCVVIAALVWLAPFVTSFQIASSNNHHSNNRQPFLFSSKSDDGSPQRRTPNEFSRTVIPDKVLKLAVKHQRTAEQSQYSVDISASSEECQALADRFSLPRIDSLGASLSLAPEGGDDAVRGSRSKGILVEGTAYAKVTRICVRSNEEFDVNLEFPVECVVRPVDGLGPIFSGDNSGISEVKLNRGSKRQTRKQRQRDSYAEEIEEAEEEDEEEIDSMELLKMESMLNKVDDNEDISLLEDILMEDENIYATNGKLDIGELVAQLFWLDLDPYPRKPGSEFLQFSITG